MPPRKFSFEMSVDMPRVNEKKICLYERTLEVGRLNELRWTPFVGQSGALFKV